MNKIENSESSEEQYRKNLKESNEFLESFLNQIKEKEPPLFVINIPYEGKRLEIAAYSNGAWEGLPDNSTFFNNFTRRGFKVEYIGGKKDDFKFTS